MKRMLKAVSLVVLGFVLCFGLMVGFSVRRASRHIGLMGTPRAHLHTAPSQQENAVKREIRKLFTKGDVEGLNQILSVGEGEVILSIRGANSFPSTATPVAEVIIENQSERSLTMFEPDIMRLSTETNNHNGFLRNDYILSFPVSLQKQCHILAPGETMSFPMLFRVAGAGRHKINLSCGFPVYKEVTSRSSSSHSPVVARTEYVFDIQEEEERPPLIH